MCSRTIPEDQRWNLVEHRKISRTFLGMNQASIEIESDNVIQYEKAS